MPVKTRKTDNRIIKFDERIANRIINFDEMIDDDLKIHYENDNPLSIQHPSRALLIGPSGSGKSNLLLNLLFHKSFKMTYHRIYMIVRDMTEDKNRYLMEYFAGLETKIKKETGEEMKIFTISDKLEDIPNLDSDIDKDVQNILILDDLITVKNQKVIEDYYVRSRKKNVTCIYLTQSYFKVPKTIRLNTDYFFLFAVPSRRELTNLFLEFGQSFESQREFNQVVRESTKARNFIILDLRTSIDVMRYRSGFDQGWEIPDPSLESKEKPKLVKIVP